MRPSSPRSQTSATRDAGWRSPSPASVLNKDDGKEARKKLQFNQAKILLKRECQTQDQDRSGWLTKSSFFELLKNSEIAIEESVLSPAVKQTERDTNINYLALLDSLEYDRLSGGGMFNLQKAVVTASNDRPTTPRSRPGTATAPRPGSARSQRSVAPTSPKPTSSPRPSSARPSRQDGASPRPQSPRLQSPRVPALREGSSLQPSPSQPQSPRSAISAAMIRRPSEVVMKTLSKPSAEEIKSVVDGIDPSDLGLIPGLTLEQFTAISHIVDALDPEKTGFLEKEELTTALHHFRLDKNPMAFGRVLSQCDIHHNSIIYHPIFIELLRKRVAQDHAAAPLPPKPETPPVVESEEDRRKAEKLAKRVALALRSVRERAEDGGLNTREMIDKLDPEVADLAGKLREKVYQHRDLLSAFRRFDTDKSGEIDPEEFTGFCRFYHFTHPQAVVDALFNLIDKEGKGNLSFEDFAQAVTTNSELSRPVPGESSKKFIFYGTKGVINDNLPLKQRPARRDCIPNLAALGGVDVVPKFSEPVEQLREQMKVKIYEKSKNLQKTFRSFDLDHSGFLNADEFRDAVRCYHFAVSDEVIDQLFKRANVDGSGLLSYSEFADYLMFDNAEKKPYVMTEDELRRKFVILKDCIMFSDVKPKPRKIHPDENAFHPPPNIENKTLSSIRNEIDEQRDMKYHRILQECKNADPRKTGFLNRMDFERRLRMHEINTKEKAVDILLGQFAQNDDVQYVKFLDALELKVERDGYIESGKPLGESKVQSPFAILEDIRTGRQHSAHKIVGKYEKMVMAFRMYDRDNSGFLAVQEFRSALDRMGLNLTEAETKLVVEKALAESGSDGYINYERFVGTMFQPSGTLLPHFITHPRARDAGDILGWTTPPVRKEGVADRMLFYRGEYMMNDSVRVARTPQRPDTTPEPTPRSYDPEVDEREIDVREQLFRSTNPLLIRSAVGSPKHRAVPLPSHENPEFTYGISHKRANDMKSVMGNVYGTQWFDSQRVQRVRDKLMTSQRPHRSATRSTILRNEAIARRKEFFEDAQNPLSARSRSATPRSHYTATSSPTRPSTGVTSAPSSPIHRPPIARSFNPSPRASVI